MLQTKNGAGSPAKLCLMPAAGLCPTQRLGLERDRLGLG